MSNTQNTDHYSQLLSNTNASNNSESDTLIQEMVTYSQQLESSIELEVISFDFTTPKSLDFKTRIDQLDSSILEELGGLLIDFLVYIVAFEKHLHYTVESFQRSSSLQNTNVDAVVLDLRKKGKSKIPPAASLPHRPRPDGTELAQIKAALSLLINDIDSEFYSFLLSYVELLEIFDYLTSFLSDNREAISTADIPSLDQLSKDMIIYTISLIPRDAELQTPQIYNTVKSVQFASTLNDLENEVDSSLFVNFQSFLSYIEILENASN